MGSIPVELDYENKILRRTTMENSVEVKFKHVPFNSKFEYEGQEYEKTSHNRGFYHKDGRVVTKTFRKSKIVNTSGEYFDFLLLTNS